MTHLSWLRVLNRNRLTSGCCTEIRAETVPPFKLISQLIWTRVSECGAPSISVVPLSCPKEPSLKRVPSKNTHEQTHRHTHTQTSRRHKEPAHTIPHIHIWLWAKTNGTILKRVGARTIHFSLFWRGLACSLGVRALDFDPRPFEDLASSDAFPRRADQRT